MDNNKILAKNTLILGIGQFIPKLIAMLILPILTKVFSTEEYGIYDLIISFASLALPLMTLLIQQAVFRFLIGEKNKDICKSYITNAIIFFFLLSFVWIILMILLGSFINIEQNLLVVIFLLYFSESLYDLLGQITRGKGENTTFSIAVIMYSIVNMILLLIALFIKSVNIINVLIMTAISYIIASIFLYLKMKIKEYIDVKLLSINITKKLLAYSVPIIPSSISLWIVNLSDRVIIKTFLGASFNGLYATASKIPNLFGTVYNVFNLAWTELAARSIEEKEIDKYYSKLFDNLYSFLIGMVLLLITFSPIMFKILIDEKFNGGYSQMPLLFIGVLLSCMVSFYGGLYIAVKKTKQVGISSMIGGILNIIINIVFINKFGLYAASISTIISFFIILIYRLFEIRKFIAIKYKYSNIILGIIFLTICVINFYIGNTIFFIINIIIAIIYNIVFNTFLRFLKNVIISKIIKN